MIITCIDNYHGNDNEYISIDLSDNECPNRILDIYENKNSYTNEYEFTIQAQWSADECHPRMKMNEKDFLDFAEAINKLAKKIIEK